MAKALESAGIKVEGNTIQVLPKATAAAKRDQELEAAIETLSTFLGPDDPAPLGVKKELETEKQRAGTHAQLKMGNNLQMPFTRPRACHKSAKRNSKIL